MPGFRPSIRQAAVLLVMVNQAGALIRFMTPPRSADAIARVVRNLFAMPLLAKPSERLFGRFEQEAHRRSGGALYGRQPAERRTLGRCGSTRGASLDAAVSQSHSVIIVEDDALVAFEIEDSLEEAGFKICGVAATASAGLALFHEFRPEFAVLDVRLAEGDGRDVAREIAAFSRETTILMCTAEDEDHLHGIGAHALLRKPFDFKSVGAALVATRCWSKGEWTVNPPPRLIPLRSGC